MTAIAEDSFGVPAIGRQNDSKKESMPAFSFGTGSRDVARLKLYYSAKHEKKKSVFNSPGPVYSIPSTVGDAPRFGFGTDEQRKHSRAKYPDSSVDLTCSVVDSQTVKYDTTKQVHFGTESRLNSRNAEIIRVHPASAMGRESPGALEYTPDETCTTKMPPEYSFGPKVPKAGEKAAGRLIIPITATPRHVGPGSHLQPSSLGAQPSSARNSAPQWGFGSSNRSASVKRGGSLIDQGSDISSIGKQVVSNTRSSPRYGFGTSTRDQLSRTQVVKTAMDLGPTATLPSPRFHMDLPRRDPTVKSPGL